MRPAHDVFISHSTADETWARATLETLEGLGLRCWIAPRDIVAGKTWAGAIVEAIHSCRLMVLILSRHSNESPQVTRELTQAAERGVHVLPLRVDDVQPSSDKAYYLGAAHWRTVLGGPTEENLALLREDVGRLLEMPAAPQPERRAPRATGARWYLWGFGAVAGIGLAIAAKSLLAGGRPSAEEPKNPAVVQPRRDDRPASEPEPEPGESKSPTEPAPVPPAEPGPDVAAVASDPRWSALPASMREAFEPLAGEWRESDGRVLPAALRHRGTGIEFLLVPGGRFTLGSPPAPPEVEHDEYPVRVVSLSHFYMARHETTVAQWTDGADPSTLPVVHVAYQQAADWCSAHGLALPTEAQWEYAASGSDDRKFPWGDEWQPERCNWTAASDGFRDLAPVGSFARTGGSWCGVEDLAGNASEWCRGFYSPDYLAFTETDPEPPAQGSFRVARGGSWSDRAPNLRTSDRRQQDPSTANGYLGFRCVFEP